MALLEIKEQTKTLTTAEELWQMSDRKKFELVRGELIEMSPPGGTHGSTAVRLSMRLQRFVEEHQLGEVMVESGFRLASNPDTVRGPDISFLAKGRIPSTGLPAGFISGAPDLAVEIVSPGDTASEVQDKVQEYLTSGSHLVWVVYPQQQIVSVHYPDGTAKTLQAADRLEGEAVIPGFSCNVGEIFA